MRMALILAVLLAATLAGCAEETVDDAPENIDDKVPVAENVANGTVVERIVALQANATEGDAPLMVAFNVTLMGADGNTTYSFATGDGNVTRGNTSDLSPLLDYTYVIGGNFTATLDVDFGNETIQASINVTVRLTQEAAQAAPDVTEFSYADSLGCAGDVLQIAGLNCFSALEGPSTSGIDGYWQALDDRYWGLAFSSTVDNVLGDSDCFFTDDAFVATGEGNNGGSPCGGTVPDGTAWLFMYSYAEPALSQTLTFQV